MADKGDRYIPVLFTLPGKAASCVKHAFKCGVIDSNTKIIACERDHKTYPHTHEALSALTPNFVLYQSELHKIDLSYAKKKLNITTPITNAWFDFCGYPNFNNLYWLIKNQSSFEVGSRLSFTFMLTPQREKVHTSATKLFDMIHTNFNLMSDSEYASLIASDRECTWLYSELDSVLNQAIRRNIYTYSRLIACGLPNFKLSFDRSFVYSDSNQRSLRMVIFDVKLIGKDFNIDRIKAMRALKRSMLAWAEIR